MPMVQSQVFRQRQCADIMDEDEGMIERCVLFPHKHGMWLAKFVC